MELYLPTRKDADKEENWSIDIATKRLQRRDRMLLLLKKINAEEPVQLPSRVVIPKKQEAHRLLTEILDRTLSHPVMVNDEAARSSNMIGADYMIGADDIKVENESPGKLKEKLKVPSVCKIHGDLHFGNILVDAYFPEDPLFVLVDPRPDIRHGDPAFDVAKLLFSCHAAYDFIDTKNFDLNIVERAPPDYRLIHMKIPDLDSVHVDMPPGAVAFGLISKESTLPKATPSLFQAAEKGVLAGSEKLQEELNDSGIIDRARYLEAILCLTLGESHVVVNPKGALALTLRGLQMLKAWRGT